MTADPSTSQELVVSGAELEAKLIWHIQERLHIEVPGPDAELLDSGLIDSLAFVELLIIVSEEFGVEADIADLDMENFRSVSQIAAFIAARRTAERPATS